MPGQPAMRRTTRLDLGQRAPARTGVGVLGTDEKSGLLAYDMHGKQLQDLRVGRLNNVDVRKGFQLGERQVDLAVASNRDRRQTCTCLPSTRPAAG